MEILSVFPKKYEFHIYFEMSMVFLNTVVRYDSKYLEKSLVYVFTCFYPQVILLQRCFPWM